MNESVEPRKEAAHALIDVDSLRTLRHKCDGCAGRAAGESCCSRFDVCVTKSEMRRVVGFLPYIVKYCCHLLAEDGLDNVFDKTDDGLYSVDTDEKGLCVFAYRKQGRTLCGIHSAAVGAGLDWRELKPLGCILWPLSISNGSPQVISVDESAGCFHCNTIEAASGRKTLDPAVIDILRDIAGSEAASDIEHAARKGLHRAKIPLCGRLAGEAKAQKLR